MNGKAPSLGFQTATTADSRLGFTVKIPSKSGSRESVQSMKDQFFTTHAPRLFNSLPRYIRNVSPSVSQEVFKGLVDQFLETVPDQPVLAGYHTVNQAQNGYMSNSVVDWSRRNPSWIDWIPATNNQI